MLDFDEESALSGLKGKFEFDNEKEKIKKEKLGITFAIGKDRGDYNRFSSQLKRDFKVRGVNWRRDCEIFSVNSILL